MGLSINQAQKLSDELDSLDHLLDLTHKEQL